MSEIESFDPIWEQKYQQGHAQHYPWDNVVSFIYSSYPKDIPRENIKILEVGCGTASNLWFAAREGFQVFGLDGSQAAIDFAKEKFNSEKLSGDLIVGDFTDLPYEDNSFDLVVDRAAITCCGFSSASKAVSEVNRVLKNKGKFLFNPYSKTHSSYDNGTHDKDGLVKNISAGTLKGSGQICLYNEEDVNKLFENNWSFLSMQHLELIETMDDEKMRHAEWRVILEKKS